MKKITIPKLYGHPTASFWLNKKHYTFPSGREIEVPDEIAALLEAVMKNIPKPEMPIPNQPDLSQNDPNAADYVKGKEEVVFRPDTAEIGQTIVVKSVDENGKPTEWEAADLPTNYRLIKRIMLEEETATIDAFTTDEDGNEFNLRDIVVVSSNLTRGESSTDTSGGSIRVWVSTKNFYNAFANSSIFTSNAYICPDYLSNISNGIYAAVHLFGTVACCEENKADGTMRKRFYVAAKGDFIQRIAFSTNNANVVTMAPGTIIEVWGVDA